MGIPLFFNTIAKEYGDVIDNTIPKNINGLYLDLNCAIHPCCARVLDTNYMPSNRLFYENKMIKEVENYIVKLINLTKPKLIFIAIDGVAPLAKMKQQRSRRFKHVEENTWDTNSISPGTPFMEKLKKSLDIFISKNKVFNGKKTIFSDASIPGEGEHKILSYLRKHTPQGNNVIYGLDADLIMLSMVSNLDNIFLLREEVVHGITKETFITVNIDELKDIIVMDFKDRFAEKGGERIDKIKIINDYVFICFFLGNDFLPHLLALDLRNNGLTIIMNSYVETMVELDKTLIDNKQINKDFLISFVHRLSLKEDLLVKKIFEKRLSLNRHFKIRADTEEEKQKQLELNKPILDMEEEKKIIIDTPNNPCWRSRYYYYTHVESVDKLCENYVDGLYWTTEYYFEGVKNWRWQYKHNHAPLLKDLLVWLKKNDCKNMGITNNPVSQQVQLLSIFPVRSANLIEKKYTQLMTSIDSPMLYLYPLDYKVDTLFKRYSWLCQPVLPTININLIESVIG